MGNRGLVLQKSLMSMLALTSETFATLILVQLLRVLFLPIAHIALHRHGVVGRDIVTYHIVEGARDALQFGIGLLDEQANDLFLGFAIVHRLQDKVAPVVEP